MQRRADTSLPVISGPMRIVTLFVFIFLFYKVQVVAAVLLAVKYTRPQSQALCRDMSVYATHVSL